MRPNPPAEPVSPCPRARLAARQPPGRPISPGSQVRRSASPPKRPNSPPRARFTLPASPRLAPARPVHLARSQPARRTAHFPVGPSAHQPGRFHQGGRSAGPSSSPDGPAESGFCACSMISRTPRTSSTSTNTMGGIGDTPRPPSQFPIPGRRRSPPARGLPAPALFRPARQSAPASRQCGRFIRRRRCANPARRQPVGLRCCATRSAGPSFRARRGGGTGC